VIGSCLKDRYRLDAELGRGGMGIVYRARDTLLERDVAVKVLSAEVLGTEGRARLLHEAQAAAQLHHPNVVTVHDAGEAEGSTFIVMELVEGASLFEQRPQGLDEILAVAQQVCAALEHAHSHGIVHRDLKLENVLLAPDPQAGTVGTAKLTDFGLARSVASRLTKEGIVAGSVFYMAPEMAMGQPFDGRADLYALGVMLYELLIGRLPFEADDPLAVISQHLHAPVVPPRARNSEIPPALDALVVQLLSKDPERRPASAAEVEAALALLAAGEVPPGLPQDRVTEVSRLDRIVRGRLVARDQELAQARDLWQRARAGGGQLLLVSGEPGVGKTRLLRELVTQVQVAGHTALVGECYAEGGTPYAPFAQLLRRAYREGNGEGPDLPEFVLADLMKLAPSLRLRFPEVRPNPALDPESEQQRLFESVVAWCTALSQRRPVLLALEDAHWADSGSLALLRHLARRTRRQPVLLIATYREVELDQTRPLQELLTSFLREQLGTRLKLARLDREGTRELLSTLFAEEITPEFLAGIYRETEGNPFFVEEVAKALVESGQVTFAGGRWHRPPAMEQLVIPQSVRVAIQSRVGMLPDGVQEALRLAAILGREFDFETLSEAAQLGEETLIDALEMAEGAHMIEEVSGEGGVAFAFVHALFPAILAEGVRTLRRRRLHRRAADAIERLRPDDYEALAHHYTEAGDEVRALRYHTRAGERASAAYANADAERHFLAALDLVPAGADEAHLLAELGRVEARQGRYRQAIETWARAIVLRQELGDQEAQAWLYAWSARAAWNAGEPPRGLALCREGLAAVEGAPDSPGLANLLHETARACFFGGLPQEAGALGRRALEMAEQVGAVSVQADALITLGTLRGQPAEQALALLSRAVALAEAHHLLAHAARAHNNLGAILGFHLGDQPAGQEHLLRAAEHARRRGAVAQELFYLANVAQIAFQSDLGLTARQLPRLRYLLEATADPGPAGLMFRGVEALLSLAREDPAVGIEGLQSVRDEARHRGDLQLLGAASNIVADALLDLGEMEEAASALREAIETGDRGVVYAGVWPRCRLSAIRARQGRLEEARRLLSEARHKTAEAGSRAWDQRWLPVAEAHLAAATGQWPTAWTAFQAAAEGFAQAGNRWYRARILAQWAKAHLARGHAGDRARAQELLRQAITEFEAMGAPAYAARMQACLAALGSSAEP
jgi:tetratricopeptide (TPR) repeat protein